MVAIQRDPLCSQDPCYILQHLQLLSPIVCRGQGHLPVTISPSSQLISLSDRYVSHFETEGPHVLLYFDSVSRGGDTGGHGWYWVTEQVIMKFSRGYHISGQCSQRERVM